MTDAVACWLIIAAVACWALLFGIVVGAGLLIEVVIEVLT
jgi:hypothetical protein